MKRNEMETDISLLGQVLTTGVDIIEIDRIRQSIERWGGKFLNRIYTKEELNYCKCRIPSLAGRFAAKEATMKALGTGTIGVGWKEIEIVRLKGQSPFLKLHGRACEKAKSLGLNQLAISLSHSKYYAVATVVGIGQVTH